MQVFKFIKLTVEERKFADGATTQEGLIEGTMRTVDRYSHPYIDDDDAIEVVENIFDKYGLDIDFYFMHRLKHVPWALVIFTEEQNIAGHIALVRRGEPGKKILFTTYTSPNDENDDGYVPKVGVIHMPSKRLCEYNSHHSPLFKTIWNELKDYDARHHWVLIMDKLPDELKELSTEENTSLWNSQGAR